MKNKKELSIIINKLSKKEILKLRQSYNANKGFDNYLYNALKKLFRKLVFPYFRFEVLLCTIQDIINKNYCFYGNEKDIKKLKLIFSHLQKICFHLNIALNEFNKILYYIDKQTSD